MKKHTARVLRKEIKIHFAAHHFVYHSKSSKEIAKVVNVAPHKVFLWSLTDEWRKALKLWQYAGDPFVEDFYEYASSFTNIEEKWAQLFETPDLETVTNIPIFTGEMPKGNYR